MSQSRENKVLIAEKVMQALEPWLLQLMRFSLNDTAVAEQRRLSAEMLVEIINEAEKSGV